MKNPTLYQTLQVKLGSYAGEQLATTLSYQDRYGNTVEKPLLDATLDEVAFAIQMLNSESSALHRRRRALDELYLLAREHGCLGAETIGTVAMQVTQ